MSKDCPTGKRRYGSRYDARSAILAVWARKKTDVNIRGSYYCPDCDGWHLTSRRKNNGRNPAYTEGKGKWRSSR